MAIAGGIFYGKWIANRLFIPVPARATDESHASDGMAPPHVGLVVLLVTLPVILIFAATAASATKGPFTPALLFLGHPFTALTITALACMYVFGFRRGMDRNAVGRLTTESLAPIGTLLAIMGGGGAFKQVIVDSGVGPYAGQLLASSSISPLLLAYAVAAAMRIAQGSATVRNAWLPTPRVCRRSLAAIHAPRKSNSAGGVKVAKVDWGRRRCLL